MIKCGKDRKEFPMLGDGEEHSMIWGIFMAVTMESAVFMGKNFQNNQYSIVNTADLTLKQMFDISAKLVTEQDEISGLDTIVGKHIHGNICHKLVMKESSIFNTQKSTSFQILYCVLGRSIRILNLTKLGRKRIEWITSSQSYRNFHGINGEPTEFEWNIFTGFDTLSQRFTEQIRRNTRKSHRKNSLDVDVQRHFLWNKRQ